MHAQRRYVLNDWPSPATFARHSCNIQTPSEIKQRDEENKTWLDKERGQDDDVMRLTSGKHSQQHWRRRSWRRIDEVHLSGEVSASSHTEAVR